MRVVRWSAYGVGAILLMVGAALAYTSRAPYELPPQRWLEGNGEFEPPAPTREDGRTLVLLVFDGLAPATLKAARTPNLDRMGHEGASTRRMLPVFPSLSMPNHTSLSTGCQPERHGVVGNHFRDPDRGVATTLGDADWLLQCEPLHVAAERQGVRSAVLAWVNSVSGEHGQLASTAEPYREPAPSLEQQIDRVLSLLAGDSRPGYLASYSAQPDRTGHMHGPLGAQTIAMLESVDGQIGRVLTAIDERRLRDQITLLVTTDHGMVDVKGMLNVDGIVARAGIDATVLGEGSIAFVHLDDPGTKATALAALAGGTHYDVFDPAQPPAYAHLGKSPRVGDLVITAHEGYWMADLALWPWHLRWSSYVSGDIIPSNRFKGMHGYNPEQVPGVRSVFYAWGARVKPGVVIADMAAVDVHPTAAYLMGIEPGAPIDGVARTEIVLPDGHQDPNAPDAGVVP